MSIKTYITFPALLVIFLLETIFPYFKIADSPAATWDRAELCEQIKSAVLLTDLCIKPSTPLLPKRYIETS